MNSLKITFGHYLNDDFSSVEKTDLWNKLINYIKTNGSSLSSIKYIEKENIIKCFYNNEKEILPIINKINPELNIDKYLIRTTKLNVEFDKEKKYLKISNKNIEDFNDYNEIFYSSLCSSKQNTDNSLFFHESSLVDYTNNFNKNDWNECEYSLFCIFYNVNQSMLDKYDNISNVSFNEKSFLCYNNKTNKLIDNCFYDSLNINSNLDLKKFIKYFNCNKFNDDLLDNIIIENEFKKIIHISDIKYVISSFKLMNGKMDDFINFKSFINLSIYESFIKKLLNKSISLKEH